MTIMNDRLAEISKLISEQIHADMRALESEERAPGFSAEESEDKMKELRKRVHDLRAIRNELEGVFTGTQVE